VKTTTGVSFVVPVHNGAAYIRDTLASIIEQADGRPMEIIVVDDGSRDESLLLLKRLSAIWQLRVLTGDGRGAAAAINLGVREAKYPIVCQIDQDVMLQRDWLSRVMAAFENDPSVGAVQGCYVTDRDATLFVRVMALDLEQRYSAIGRDTDHVCTGNVAYRTEALHRVGLFDETLGYGYDNDMSYRLQHAGYRLTFCRTARSHHRWREGLLGYVRQQYGFGYGRLDVVAKHPTRIGGDAVSRASMMLHPLLTAVALVCVLAASVVTLAGSPSPTIIWTGPLILGVLAAERLISGLSAARRFRDATALLFPVIHLVRDFAWVAAMAVWTARRCAGNPALPGHSMHPRTPETGAAPAGPLNRESNAGRHRRILAIIPAHNEAGSLGSVVAELRRNRPDVDVLVVDDGSTDATSDVLLQLGVRSIRFPERLGIGSAMRAGLRYALRAGYAVAVRIDGDGQHRVADLAELLGPVDGGSADVTIGSRYRVPSGTADEPPLAQRALAECLSLLVDRKVTDPTSGFCALNTRSMALLAEHHPTGYPEPELLLFLHRNHMRVVEVPVATRERLAGRTSLTPGRLTTAGARVLLAILIVPLRGRVGGL